jgi:hypothetical protein
MRKQRLNLLGVAQFEWLENEPFCAPFATHAP